MLKLKLLVPFSACGSIISTDQKEWHIFAWEKRYADNALREIIAIKNVHHDEPKTSSIPSLIFNSDFHSHLIDENCPLSVVAFVVFVIAFKTRGPLPTYNLLLLVF